MAVDDLARVNDQIRELVGRFDGDVSGRFVCECDDPECVEPVVLSLSEFDSRRGTSSRIVAHDG
jgi:hypothetical protein